VSYETESLRFGPVTNTRGNMGVDKVKVLYIGGWGRSGSTLLDRMLGQVPGLFSTGELRYIWERGLLENQLCGCGLPFRECSFWGQVGKEAFGGWDEVDVAGVVGLRNSVDRLWHTPWLLGPAIWPGYGVKLEEYVNLLGRLYKAIRNVSNAKIIIDSSKAPSYAFILGKARDIDLRMVHLVRDSRGVAFSWKKQVVRPEVTYKVAYMPRYNPLTASLRYILDNGLLCFANRTPVLSRGAPPYVLVRYEDLADQPREMLARILSHVGYEVREDTFSFIDSATGRVFLGTNHMVAGNPMRFKSGEIVLRPDVEWQGKMPTSERFIVTLLTFPLLLAYGYLGREDGGRLGMVEFRSRRS